MYVCIINWALDLHFKTFLKFKILWHFLYLLRHFQLKWPKSEEFCIFVGGLVCLCYFFLQDTKCQKTTSGHMGQIFNWASIAPRSFELHNLHSPNIEKSHKNNNDINNSIKLTNCNIVREGAKNTLRGVPRIARPSAASGSPPPLLAVSDLTPPFLRPGIYTPPQFRTSKSTPPHMEKVRMRFATCITPK